GWSRMLDDFDKKIKDLKYFKVLCHGNDELKDHDFFCHDKSKILINFEGTHFEGSDLTEILREKYRFEFEMQEGKNLLAMTGPGDRREALKKLTEALLELDRSEGYIPENGVKLQLDGGSYLKNNLIQDAVLQESVTERKTIGYCFPYGITPSEQVTTLQKAAESEGKVLGFTEAKDRISAEYVYCYPPGIPIIVPGERLSGESLRRLKALRQKGCELHFTRSGEDKDNIYCITLK
nr:hypothetical protein [Oribacterium sp.]